MKRAFWYDGKDKEKDMPNYLNETRPVISCIKKYTNRSVTENGAVGYKSSQHPLVDLNFMVSSLRNYSAEYIVKEFVKAYYASRKYAIKWLFFLRDVQEGLGERRTFRVCLQYLAQSQPEVAKAVMSLIPEYGRYDDLLIFLDTDLCDEACELMKEQLAKDVIAMQEGKSVSLLAKWLPSVNTSSAVSRKRAKLMAEKFGMSEREYRKTLSALRGYSNVVEVKMSDSKWQDIDYEAVPAKANLKYENAFVKHDEARRTEYLFKVWRGESKLNGKGIMPHEIVHRMMKKRGFWGYALADDTLAELMWEEIQNQGFKNDWGFEDCIVVADGSGSMFSYASGSTGVMAIEICNALAIYFAEQLKGVFHNKAITFSESPRFIDLEPGKSLKEKLEIMFAHNEVANTNIEAVFDMLLELAVCQEVPAEELPKQVLIISDMEFDQASCTYREGRWNSFTPALFDVISKRFEAAGYQMPRLIFWNVCGRTNTIPMVDETKDICLLSGFSQNAMKVAANKGVKNQFQSLIRVLDAPRYAKVEEAIADLVS